MTGLSPSNLLDLTDLQREIVLYLTRHGWTDANILPQALGRDPAGVREALSALVERGYVRLLANGRAKVVFGRTRQRTLPAQLWPALLAPSRIYSEKEIATLRTVIPILQFARAKTGEMIDHGPGHALRVKSFVTQLSYVVGLTPTERHLLRAAALFHDVGNAVDRRRHPVISQETVEKLASAGELPFSPSEAKLIGLLCRWHSKEYDPDRRDVLHNEPIRTGLLASILRVADAMDIDSLRSDYADQFAHVVQLFYPDQAPHWSSVREILGVRIHCTPAVNLQVFVQPHVEDNIQIAMLRGDLASTPLDWSVQVIPTGACPERSRRDGPPAEQLPRSCSGQASVTQVQSTLIAFPFDPHSLVMAAFSRKHLMAAGYSAESLCYPDTAGGAAWLWGEALAKTDPADWTRLLVIGDRPDPMITGDLLQTIGKWREAGVRVSWLNRHESNWLHLPDVLRWGVEVILGGDWAYFWGDAASESDLVWGRIAALCTRDPVQSTVGLTAEEQAVAQGLLKVVYDVAEQPAEDTDGWAALAEPIMDRIAADDRAYFAKQAEGFAASYVKAISPCRVEGRVLLFEPRSGVLPQACYWAMEAAIEQQGRKPERGIRFHVPYAIATLRAEPQGEAWSYGDMVDLLAINHWRDEMATPIRLLYPMDLGPPPEGHESAIRVCLPADKAEAVINELLRVCNQ